MGSNVQGQQNSCATPYPSTADGRTGARVQLHSVSGGTQSHACNSPVPMNGGKPCSGPSTRPCALDGGWSDWSTCPTPVGSGGEQTRQCNSPAPMNGGKQCTGSSTKPCSLFGTWGTWSGCSVSKCGETGVMTRTCSGGADPPGNCPAVAGGRRAKALCHTPMLHAAAARGVVLRGGVPFSGERGCRGLHGRLPLYVRGCRGIQQSLHVWTQLTNLLPPGASPGAARHVERLDAQKLPEGVRHGPRSRGRASAWAPAAAVVATRPHPRRARTPINARASARPRTPSAPARSPPKSPAVCQYPCHVGTVAANTPNLGNTCWADGSLSAWLKARGRDDDNYTNTPAQWCRENALAAYANMSGPKDGNTAVNINNSGLDSSLYGGYPPGGCGSLNSAGQSIVFVCPEPAAGVTRCGMDCYTEATGPTPCFENCGQCGCSGTLGARSGPAKSSGFDVDWTMGYNFSN